MTIITGSIIDREEDKTALLQELWTEYKVLCENTENVMALYLDLFNDSKLFDEMHHLLDDTQKMIKLRSKLQQAGVKI